MLRKNIKCQKLTKKRKEMKMQKKNLSILNKWKEILKIKPDYKS